MPKLILEVDVPDAAEDDDPEDVAADLVTGLGSEIISAEWA
jgi:hypothetical protein